MWKQEFFDGMRISIPLALGAGVFGLTLGLAATHAGLSPLDLGIMSATTFAGASQLVAVDMIALAAPLGAILAAVFAVNARHLLMGASLAPVLRDAPAASRYAALLTMVDESWAITSARAKSQPTGAAFMLGMASVLGSTWLATTVSGAAFGALLPNPERFALDFLGVAVFVGLLIIIKPGRGDVLPFAVTALLSPLFADLLPGSWNIIAAASIGAAVATLKP